MICLRGVSIFLFLILFSVFAKADDLIDPDIRRNVSQLLTSRGYGCERHSVITEDGYILLLHRILPSPQGPNTGKPIFLQHVTWIMNYNETQNLGTILVDNGYDVWMGNSRGNTYSRSHVSLDPNSDAYWNFSFDEMAKYDVPACINYVLETTSQEKLSYIGHSQGTTILFTGKLLDSDLARKIDLFQALAPVTYLQYLTQKLLVALSDIPDFLIYDLLGRQGFAEDGPAFKASMDILCTIDSELCGYSICDLAGCESEANYNQTRYPVLFSHFPAGTSVKNIVHFSQLVGDPHCSYYDYGVRGNEDHYGTRKTPSYNVTNYDSPPLAPYSGGLDLLADPSDVADLIKPIEERESQPVESWVTFSDYGHGDFVWGLDACVRLYPLVLKALS